MILVEENDVVFSWLSNFKNEEFLSMAKRKSLGKSMN